jgi:hypothetical protein
LSHSAGVGRPAEVGCPTGTLGHSLGALTDQRLVTVDALSTLSR